MAAPVTATAVLPATPGVGAAETETPALPAPPAASVATMIVPRAGSLMMFLGASCVSVRTGDAPARMPFQVTETLMRLYWSTPVPEPQPLPSPAPLTHWVVRLTTKLPTALAIVRVESPSVKTSFAERSRSISWAARFVAISRARPSLVMASTESSE